MNKIGQTQKFQQNKLNKPNASSGIRSLRSIINQTKIPLSQYMNGRNSIEKKVNVNKTLNSKPKLTYFQKLKGMITSDIGYHHSQIKQNEQFMITKRQNMQNYEQNMQQEVKQLVGQSKKQTTIKRTINNDYSQQKRQSQSGSKRLQIFKQRLSFYPKTSIKTQIIRPIYKANALKINTNTFLPPKPPKKQAKISNLTQLTRRLKQQLYQHKSELSKQEMTQQIHSFRRLNFFKQQQRRKQIIQYQKKFQFININQHYSNMVSIINKGFVEITQILGIGAYAYVKLGTIKSTNTMQHKANINTIKHRANNTIQPKANTNQHKDYSNSYKAIKIYQKYKLLQPSIKSRVLKQTQLLSCLSHPNIISLFCSYQNSRQIHMLFQHLQNSITLQQYFKHKRLELNLDEIIQIVRQVTEGLKYLHENGIAHRDIKMDNVLVTWQDQTIIIKIIDFGFATNNSHSKMQCGTPNYMAPELFRKGLYSTYQTDIWALGVMFYYLIQGKYPFKGYNQTNLIHNINTGQLKFDKTPFEIQELIKYLLHKNVQQRFSLQNIVEWFNNYGKN